MAFKKGVSGNPSGRPKDSGKIAKLRAAIVAELPGIISTLLIQAKAGDIQAAKLLSRSPSRLYSALQPMTV
jgi:hypothetical protein